MNYENAQTESLWRYLKFHEKHNLSVKSLAIAVALLEKEIESKGNQAFKDQMSELDEPWGNSPVGFEPVDLVSVCSGSYIEAGIVRVFSAYEVYCTSMLGSFDSMVSSENVSVFKCDSSSEIESTESHMPNRLLNVYGLETSGIDSFQPAFDFFRLLRNCIVHRNGVASKALVEKRYSEEFLQCIETWPCKNPLSILNDLPEIGTDQELSLKPRHSILASEVILKILYRVDKLIVEHVGLNGLLYLASRSAFSSVHASKIRNKHLPDYAVNQILIERFRVSGISSIKLTELLRGAGLWEYCKASHANALQLNT